jgi:hypothetical protein
LLLTSFNDAISNVKVIQNRINEKLIMEGEEVRIWKEVVYGLFENTICFKSLATQTA